QPTEINRRTFAPPPTAIIGPILASAFIDAFVPFAECHFVASDSEGLRKSHAVYRILVFRCRAHDERTRREHSNLIAVGGSTNCMGGLEAALAEFGRRRSQSGLRRGLDDRWRHGGRCGSGGRGSGGGRRRGSRRWSGSRRRSGSRRGRRRARCPEIKLLSQGRSHPRNLL